MGLPSQIDMKCHPHFVKRHKVGYNGSYKPSTKVMEMVSIGMASKLKSMPSKQG